MKQLNLDNVRAFVTVYDLQSYTLAGERLGRSQPAVSLQIKRLEQQLDASLLQRSDNRIKLTSAGQTLYAQARQLLALNDQIFAQFSESSISGDVRLGIPSEFASTLLPSILGQFATSYPQVTLDVTSGLSRDLRLGAQRGHFDLILTVADSAPEHALQLKRDDLVWVAGKSDYKQPRPLALVLAPEGCIYRRRALKALGGIVSRIAYTNSDLACISSALRSNLGITVLARSSIPADLYELRNPLLPELGSVGIYLEHHGRPGNLAARYLSQHIQEALA